MFTAPSGPLAQEHAHALNHHEHAADDDPVPHESRKVLPNLGQRRGVGGARRPAHAPLGGRLRARVVAPRRPSRRSTRSAEHGSAATPGKCAWSQRGETPVDLTRTGSWTRDGPAGGCFAVTGAACTSPALRWPPRARSCGPRENALHEPPVSQSRPGSATPSPRSATHSARTPRLVGLPRAARDPTERSEAFGNGGAPVQARTGRGAPRGLHSRGECPHHLQWGAATAAAASSLTPQRMGRAHRADRSRGGSDSCPGSPLWARRRSKI